MLSVLLSRRLPPTSLNGACAMPRKPPSPASPHGRGRSCTSGPGAAGSPVDRSLAACRPTRPATANRRPAGSAAPARSCTDRRRVARRSRPSSESSTNLSIIAAILREQFADFDARHVRLDRLELAADLGRGVGLQVPHVLMRRAAGQEDIDDRLVRSADARLSFRRQQLRAATARPSPCRRFSESRGATGRSQKPLSVAAEDGEHGPGSLQYRGGTVVIDWKIMSGMVLMDSGVPQSSPPRITSSRFLVFLRAKSKRTTDVTNFTDVSYPCHPCHRWSSELGCGYCLAVGSGLNEPMATACGIS